MTDKEIQFGEVAYQQVYNSDDFEVIIRTGHRPPTPRRLCLCTREGDAEAIVEAMTYAIENGIIT